MKLSDYEKLLEGKTCRFHIHPPKIPAKIKSYDHDGGYTVEGFEKKQWLYVTCKSCGYDWSVWKLGIPREENAA